MKAILITLSIFTYSITAFAQDKAKLNLSAEEIRKIVPIKMTEHEADKIVSQNLNTLYVLSEDVDRIMSGLGFDRGDCEGKNNLESIGSEKRFCLESQGDTAFSAYGSESKEVDQYGARITRGSGPIKIIASTGYMETSAKAGGMKNQSKGAYATVGASISLGGKKSSSRKSQTDRETAKRLAIQESVLQQIQNTTR